MDLSTLQRPVLPPDLSTPQGPELHLDVSVQKDSLLVWTCLPVSTSLMTLSLMTSFKPGFMNFEYCYFKGTEFTRQENNISGLAEVRSAVFFLVH